MEIQKIKKTLGFIHVIEDNGVINQVNKPAGKHVSYHL
jgi:hypothetical protein